MKGMFPCPYKWQSQYSVCNPIPTVPNIVCSVRTTWLAQIVVRKQHAWEILDFTQQLTMEIWEQDQEKGEDKVFQVKYTSRTRYGWYEITSPILPAGLLITTAEEQKQ